MNKLAVQIIIRQWDKSQLSDQHKQERQSLADRYPIHSSALVISDGQILLDQHGDDLMKNRVQYQLTEGNIFLMDRFRFRLDEQTIEFKPKLQADELPIMLFSSKKGWVQCHYQWRYRVNEGGYIYWLYESVTANAGFDEKWDSNLFINSAPEKYLHDLLE